MVVVVVVVVVIVVAGFTSLLLFVLLVVKEFFGCDVTTPTIPAVFLSGVITTIDRPSLEEVVTFLVDALPGVGINTPSHPLPTANNDVPDFVSDPLVV